MNSNPDIVNNYLIHDSLDVGQEYIEVNTEEVEYGEQLDVKMEILT